MLVVVPLSVVVVANVVDGHGPSVVVGPGGKVGVVGGKHVGMVVVGNSVVVVADGIVVDGHGGKVVGTIVGNVLFGFDVVTNSVVDVGHGPTPPPGSGQSTKIVVVVVPGTTVVGVPVQPYRWRSPLTTCPAAGLVSNAASRSSCWQTRARTSGGSWLPGPPTCACPADG